MNDLSLIRTDVLKPSMFYVLKTSSSWTYIYSDIKLWLWTKIFCHFCLRLILLLTTALVLQAISRKEFVMAALMWSDKCAS